MTRKNNFNKYGIAALKAGIAAIPGGSLVVELLNVTIPDRRLERIEKLLMILASKELDMDSKAIKQKFNSPEFADIFEDVIHQVIKALSDDRLGYLASVLEKSLTDEKINHLQSKRLLFILNQINDIEIILLQYFQLNTCVTLEKKGQFSRKNEEAKILQEKRQNFQKQHIQIIQCLYSDINYNYTEDEKDRSAMIQSYRDNLISLGLIGKQYNEFRITRVGGSLLNLIGCGNDYFKFYASPLNPFEIIKISEENDKKTSQGIVEEITKALKDINSMY